MLIQNIDEKAQFWIRFWPVDQFFGCCEKSSKNDDAPSVLHPRPNLYIIIDRFCVVMGKKLKKHQLFEHVQWNFPTFWVIPTCFFPKQKDAHGFKWRFNSHSANGQPLNFLGTMTMTYLIFIVVGKIRCNLLFHGPKWLSENLISSGFATWKCLAILVVTCYCPWAKPPPKRRPHLAPVAVAAAAPVEGSTPKAPPVTQQKLRLEPWIFVLMFEVPT